MTIPWFRGTFSMQKLTELTELFSQSTLKQCTKLDFKNSILFFCTQTNENIVITQCVRVVGILFNCTKKIFNPTKEMNVASSTGYAVIILKRPQLLTYFLSCTPYKTNVEQHQWWFLLMYFMVKTTVIYANYFRWIFIMGFARVKVVNALLILTWYSFNRKRKNLNI